MHKHLDKLRLDSFFFFFTSVTSIWLIVLLISLIKLYIACVRDQWHKDYLKEYVLQLMFKGYVIVAEVTHTCVYVRLVNIKNLCSTFYLS